MLSFLTEPVQFKYKNGLGEFSLQILMIYDILGKEVKTLVNEYRSAGVYEIEFNTIGLSSGIYFYQLKTGDFIKKKGNDI
jgi:Secretion system C-terminal sorting domain